MNFSFVSTTLWRRNVRNTYSSHSVPTCNQSVNRALRNFAANIRAKLHRHAEPDQPRSPRDFDRQKPSDEWLDLVTEFEQRSYDRQEAQSAPTLSATPGQTKGGRWTDVYLEYLPYVQTAFSAAVTFQLWYVGRILKLDSFLLLLYPLPCMFISARWGLSHGDRCLSAIILMIFVFMGPMFAQFFVFNSGLLTFTYTRTLWWNWPWWACLTAGGAAKAVGLIVNMAWASFVFKTNVWAFLIYQTKALIEGTFGLISKLPLVPKLGTPTLLQVKIGIIAVVVFHSLYHVFCTLLLSAILLVRVSENTKLARVPSGMPFVARILRKMRDGPSK